MTARKRVVVVGGVAGGASCAARLRRLDESAEITVLDRGPYVSFANCGLPYYVGDVIRDEGKLLVATPELFRQRFNIEVRTRHEVRAIDRGARTLEVCELASGRVYQLGYDALVLSPGAAPVRPPLAGIDLPGIFTLRTVPDSRRIREWIEGRSARRAVVVGGGFIGLEMAENLVHRGLEVTIIEMAAQLMPALDPEMADYVLRRVRTHAAEVRLGDAVAAFEPDPGGELLVRTRQRAALPADLVILAIGVRPETTLARAAGLEIGARGGIRVDEQMRTSDPHIWAVGDAVEVRNFVTGEQELIALAGPANRQGRIAADVICGRESRFRGVQGTAVCGFFGMTVAMTGATERSLRRAGREDFAAVYLHPGHHVGYYPGARPIHLKLLFRPSDGSILGAQAVGEEGVERRIDVIAMAMQKSATVFDLEEAELCYAPQYGAAKDPANLCGMLAANVARGDVALADWNRLAATDALLLDVRESEEFAAGSLPGAVNLPLGQLRGRLAELPRDREIWVHCGVGQRAYYANRLLTQHGFRVRNLSGGYQTYRAWYPQGAGNEHSGESHDRQSEEHRSAEQGSRR
jgi:NADPH-dependent 2,4-dienoyl-CoA reductase/sulfur reductase-like enzyme/rhodanese-related sulfurtransferase